MAFLQWATTNADACTASGAWSGSKPVKDALPMGPLAVGTYAYSLTCNGLWGGSVTKTAHVTVTALPRITHAPPCDLICIKRLLGSGGPIMPYGQIQSNYLGAILLIQSGTVDAMEVSRRGHNITTITISPDSRAVVSGDLGDIHIVKAKVDRSKFLDRLRTGAFGTASWTRLAAGQPGANPKIVGAAFNKGTLSGLIVAPDIAQ